MSNPNGTKGKAWERDIMRYLRSEGHDTERLRMTGWEDEGDLVVKIGGLPYIIEAKNWGKVDLSGWCREAEVESENYGRAREIHRPNFLVVNKRRNHSTRDAYVIMPFHEWLRQVDVVPF